MGQNQKKTQKKKKTVTRLPDIQKEFSIAYDYHNQGKIEKAEVLYQTIIKKYPTHSDALHLLGVIALERNDYDKALNLIKRAIINYPKAASYYNNLGLACHKKGLHDEAVRAYRKALEVDPAYSEAHNNLGTLLKDKGDLIGAVACFEAATRINTGFSVAYYNLGTVLNDQGYIPAAIVAYKKALSINPGFVQAHSNLLYTLHFSDSMLPIDIFREHQAWEAAHTRSFTKVQRDLNGDKDSERKLNIGYVSPDFRTHSVAFFLEDVLAHHNRKQVRVFCYSSTGKPDDFTHRFRELADVWRDIANISDDEAAQIIKKDKIDILVDLAGHTRNSRILIFARKPAPVQVTWLGYPDTTGLSTMDYRLTDTIADPPGIADTLATETLVRLDDGFLCYRPSGESYPISPSPVLSSGIVTFGSFNNNAKISEKTVALWARILSRVPGSRLKLKSRSFADFGTRKHILERFHSHGIPSDRIWFEGYRVSLKEHFLLYGSVDIALDTFPYNGTTTTCEALWMGVPVITLLGNSHVSRVGASLLHQVGLDELIASSEEEYVEKTVALSKDIDLLVELRSSLRGHLAESPLLDAEAFSAKIEAAFQRMWGEWVKSVQGISVLDKTFFEKNLKTLRQHHPNIEALLDEKAPFDMDVQISPSGLPNLYIKKEKGVATVLYPEENPLEDFAFLKKTIEHLRGKVLCVMGAGLFIHAKPILEIIGDKNIVVFFEAHPSIFKAALESHDLTSVIAHPNARFAIGDSADPYKIINEERDKLFTSDNGEFVEYKRAVSLAPEWYKDKRNAFDQFLKRRKISVDTSAFSGKSFIVNSFNNLLALSESLPLDTLHDVFKGIPAIIVASGPSLSKNIHELKNIKDRALIIAADSALAPLMAVGIKPHMIVSVDNNDFTYEKLAPFIDDLYDVDLLYIPNVTSKIVNGIRFKSKYYCFPDINSQKLFNRLLGREGAMLENIHSVIHLAIASAQTAGCDPIIFTGLDLAFSGTQDHAEGTLLNWGNNGVQDGSGVMVESIHGDMIPSNHGFVGMIEICQRMIQTVPDRTYIDATEGGAKIIGTMILPLVKALERFCNRSLECSEIKLPKMSSPSLKGLLSELKRLNQDIGQTLHQIKRYITEQTHVEKYLRTQSEGIDPGLLPDKIIRSVRTMDKINTLLDKDQTVSFVKSIMVESHNRYKELELDVIEGGSSKGRRFAAALKQQGFVQNIRKIGLEFLSGQVSTSILVVEMIIGMERYTTIPISEFNKIEQLIDRGYLIVAETILSKIESCPEKDYFAGCVLVKQGKTEQGRGHLDAAAGRNKALKDQRELFLKSEITTLLSKNGPHAFRSLMLNRAYSLSDPAVPETVAVCRDYVSNHAISMVINIQNDTLAFLTDAYSKGLLESPANLALLAYILISKANKDGIIYLKMSTDKDLSGDSRKPLIRMLFYSHLSFIDAERFIDFVLPALMSYETHETWVRIQLQEMWLIDFWGAEEEFFLMRFNEDRVRDTNELLDKWAEISEVIPEWHFMKAMYETALGHRKNAIIHMKRSVEIEQSTCDSHCGKGTLLYMLSWMYFFDGKHEEGLQCIEKAARMTSRIDIYMAYAFFLIRFDRREEAAGVFRDAETLDCKKELWIQRILYLYHHGEMIERIMMVSDLKPYAAWVSSAAWAMFESGMDDMALVYLEVSINDDPGAAFVWEELGDAFSAVKDYEKALLAYERCLEALPDRASTFIKMGDVYLKNGNIKSAQLAYETAIIKDPQNSAANEYLRRKDNQ